MYLQSYLPFQKELDNGSPFPLVLTPAKGSPKGAGALASALRIQEQRSQLDEWLIRSGAILLRGFDVWTGQEFDSIIDALGWEEYNYLELGGLANRKRVHGKVLTANDLPLDWYVGYHNEAAYLTKFPSKLAFFAAKPPEPGTGGATPIVPGHVVYKRVLERKHLAEQLLDKGPVVTRSYLSDKALRTQDRQTVETRAMKQNMTLTWLPEGGAILESKPLQPLFKEDSAGRMAIFTSIGSYVEFRKMQEDFPKSTIRFEDGTVLRDETADELVEIMLEEEVAFPWEKGDILLVDNSAVLHSRQKCTSKEREILVSLAQ
ncbi:clavaminate synthase-like protein At3g21360 [Selaginella moellendorffii]|uniref:clavaminate synthase-like protein At3g21360 n=1 Tax=Selaginella moellendorffii TaxID=88036 RepID=UPI000D1C8CED|nr:clavaminate synthase-like protein At3g21360 [Selaginella moellendorffii]|eukprot:XP_024525196.1 clavaminate synthase-like protein At3g21360 [Selaginella moellendorffii]